MTELKSSLFFFPLTELRRVDIDFLQSQLSNVSLTSFVYVFRCRRVRDDVSFPPSTNGSLPAYFHFLFLPYPRDQSPEIGFNFSLFGPFSVS